MSPRSELEFSAAELESFRAALYSRTGMSFGHSKRYYVERRLRERLSATGTVSLGAYLAVLRADPAEAETLINAFTVKETYFYREAHQFRCLSADLLPEIVSRRGPGDKVRIWSAPCATGEEAYSIALWLLENWRMVDAYNIEIVGSDIDTWVLGEARAGLYDARAVARLPDTVLADYFEARDDGRYQLITDLLESVAFTPVNLVDRDSMAANGRFDVIFCRNALIYFDDASRRVAAQNLFDCLEPGGFLCLGHSESMTRMSERFVQRRFTDAVVTQRPLP
ncbi:MAG TPA: protein-glutamate O-methyltransferase CheR [Caulobacteraceae bacterium]|jgi:chemotaxis protein methyltransferase CheR|nr:protein-glutamate O-methyltransferase CheR [Caulobacteraceae bacterium]